MFMASVFQKIVGVPNWRCVLSLTSVSLFSTQDFGLCICLDLDLVSQRAMCWRLQVAITFCGKIQGDFRKKGAFDSEQGWEARCRSLQRLATPCHSRETDCSVRAFPQCRHPACRIVQPIVEMGLPTSVNLLGIQSNPSQLWGGVGWEADSRGCAGDNTNLSERGTSLKQSQRKQVRWPEAGPWRDAESLFVLSFSPSPLLSGLFVLPLLVAPPSLLFFFYRPPQHFFFC